MVDFLQCLSYRFSNQFRIMRTMSVRPSSLRRWSLFLLVGFTDPYNHTYYKSLWWKLFKNHNRTQIQRQRQWQRQRQRHRHRQNAWKTQHMLYINPDDLLIPNTRIDTSPWSSCSCQSPWLPCFGHTISSTGLSVSPFQNFKFWSTLWRVSKNVKFHYIDQQQPVLHFHFLWDLIKVHLYSVLIFLWIHSWMTEHASFCSSM